MVEKEEVSYFWRKEAFVEVHLKFPNSADLEILETGIKFAGCCHPQNLFQILPINARTQQIDQNIGGLTSLVSRIGGSGAGIERVGCFETTFWAGLNGRT